MGPSGGDGWGPRGSLTDPSYGDGRGLGSRGLSRASDVDCADLREPAGASTDLQAGCHLGRVSLHRLLGNSLTWAPVSS